MCTYYYWRTIYANTSHDITGTLPVPWMNTLFIFPILPVLHLYCIFIHVCESNSFANKEINCIQFVKSAPMAWTQWEKFSSSVLHKSNTFKLQNKYVCLQNYENISLNHFVNLSLGLNCTWLNYRIHVAPTAYRTFFVTTIFEITNFFWIGNFPFFRKYVLNVLQFHSSCQ